MLPKEFTLFKKARNNDNDNESQNEKIDEEKATPKKLKHSNCYNFHSTNERIYLDDIELPNTALQYLQLNNGIKETPYCIAVDHGTKNVILAIRGSASLEDFVIDTQLFPIWLDHLAKTLRCGSVFEGEFGHKGLVRRSVWIYEDLKT